MMEEKKRRGGPQKGQKFKKRKEYPLVTCPHCGQSGRGPVMNVWHFAKCRELRGIRLVPQFGAAINEDYIWGGEDEEVED